MKPHATPVRQTLSTSLFRWLPWGLIGFGILLRLAQYGANRSLWFDEILLGLNIIDRSFSGLFQPLDYNQSGPLGFLMLEKLSVLVFGRSEYALRLFPLLSSIGALFLFYGVAKDHIKPGATLLALALFAMVDPLIDYASQVKQYSSDVAFALLLYLIASRETQNTRSNWLWLILLGVTGGVSIWFSHPAIFVLAGIGISLAVFTLIKRDRRKLVGLLFTAVFWLLSFAVFYGISLRSSTGNTALQNYWIKDFMPWPPDGEWFIHKILEIFTNPVGLAVPGLGAALFFLGCSFLFVMNKQGLFMFVLPVLLVLLASALHQYPFSGRLLLFIVPSLLLVMAVGVEQLVHRAKLLSNILAIILVGLLIAQPLADAVSHLFTPRVYEEFQPVLRYIQANYQTDDGIYLYYSGQYAFRYYSAQDGFKPAWVDVGIASRTNPDAYLADLDRLRGTKRVWVIFSHIYNWNGNDEEQFFLNYLDKLGARLDSFKSVGASTYLYDLSDPQSRH